MEEIDYLGERVFRWKVGASTFLAAPERGARLMNWNLSYADGTIRDIVHWPELSEPEAFVKARGGNPILFPFAARTFDQGEIHFWKDPSGRRRPMPMHGIARQGTFKIIRVDQKGFAAQLVSTPADQQIYPFDYEFEVIYRFEEKGFNVELRLANHDKSPIPWSAGHHFYFTIPWLEGSERSDYQISIPAKKTARHRPNGTLEEIASAAPTERISNKLVDRIHYQLSEPIVECVCLKDDSRIEIEIGTQERPNPGYTLVTWTESDRAPFFCIEPWMGPPNAPEHKIGLHLVPPGESRSFSVTVRV